MDEMDEALEIYFVMKGAIGVGFQVNKMRNFTLKFKNHCVVGGYNCSFFRRSDYIWECLTLCEGYFIFKSDWL